MKVRELVERLAQIDGALSVTEQGSYVFGGVEVAGNLALLRYAGSLAQEKGVPEEDVPEYRVGQLLRDLRDLDPDLRVVDEDGWDVGDVEVKGQEAVLVLGRTRDYFSARGLLRVLARCDPESTVELMLRREGDEEAICYRITAANIELRDGLRTALLIIK
jgi:hypothetical protein